MEAFNLLKFWQIDPNDAVHRPPPVETTDEEEDSFFDLEFTQPPGNDKERSDLPKDDVVSKGRVFPIESNSKPQSPISFLKSPQTLRLLTLFKYSKSEKAEKISSKKKFYPKVVVEKYLKLIQPLYSRASKRYGEEVKFSDKVPIATTPSCSPAPAASLRRKRVEEKQGSRQAPLRVVCKHLGKSRSASAGGAFPASVAARRDDSLLLQHDGIQSAILHCKRSYNSSREFSVLSQSASDPSDEISVNPFRNSTEEVKTRTSI